VRGASMQDLGVHDSGVLGWNENAFSHFGKNFSEFD
jgi:hypothetical protein